MVKRQMFFDDGITGPVATGFNSIVSLDDNLPIGNPVGNGYELITNEQIWEMLESALAGIGIKHQIVSVVSVGNRERLAISIQFDNGEEIGGRLTQNVLNIIWGHGGIMGVLARSGFTVVVCQNTMNLALARRGEFELRCKHTGGSVKRLEGMAQAIDAHYGVVAEFKKAMEEFANTPCDEPSARNTIAGFIVRDNDVEKISTRATNTIDRIAQLYKGGAGNRGENMADLFNGFTDYYTHENAGGENRWKQFQSSEFGNGQVRKLEAFKLLRGEAVPKLGDLETVQRRGKSILALV